MIDKPIRLINALWKETVKRIPYIFIILIVILISQFVRLNIQTAEGVRLAKNTADNNQRLLEKINELSESNKKLGEDNKLLTEQGNRLAEQSNRYLDCIAQVFAKYTRDYFPILDIELNSCSARNIYTNVTIPVAPLEPIPQPTPTTPTAPTPVEPKDKNNDKSKKP